MPPKPPVPRTQKLTPYAEKLYVACVAKATSGTQTEFTTQDLQSLKIVPKNELLLSVIEELHSAMYLVYIQAGDGNSNSASSAAAAAAAGNHGGGAGIKVTYRVREAQIARELQTLDETAQSMYTYIESSGQAGMWTKHLRAKAGVLHGAMAAAVKKLDSKGLVKQVKHVGFPARKYYMLVGLEPTDAATGGPWYGDGEPDSELIDMVKSVAFSFIKKKSWRVGPRRVLVNVEAGADDAKADGFAGGEKGKDSGGPPARKKRIVDLTDMEEELGLPALTELSKDSTAHMLLPHPPGYDDYPTASSILSVINASGVISGKDIRVQDVQQLLTVLMWEARIEPMGRKKIVQYDSDDEEEAPAVESAREEMTYRSVRVPYGQLSAGNPGSAFADTPCARCGVFRLCEEGGPVDARSCGYFAKWFGF